MGRDRAALAATAPFGSAADSRSTECGAGDLLHSIIRLSVAGFAEGFSTLCDGSGLFLYLARHWQMAKNRHGSGPQGSSPTGAQTPTNDGDHRQSERADHASRRSWTIRWR